MSRRNDELEGMLLELWEQGNSKAKIAKTLNVDISTVRRRLRQMGADQRMGNARRIKPGSKDMETAQKMRDTGLSYEKIARKLGVSATTVRAALLNIYSQRAESEVEEPQEPQELEINIGDLAKTGSENRLAKTCSLSDMIYGKSGNGTDEITATEDVINHPSHYTWGEYECIDMMVVILGLQAVIDYCKGAALKYQYRCGHKGSLQDAEDDQKKMCWYLRKAEELEKRMKGETSQ